MAALDPLLCPDGILLDTFIESTFCWERKEYEDSGVLPYRRSWVGFVHNPPGIPLWHEYSSAPQSIFQLPSWRASLGTCRGLFTFSKTMAARLGERLQVPIAALIHPTEAPKRFFDLDRFLAFEKPRILQVGSWLRRISSIALLPVTRLQRTYLMPKPHGEDYLRDLIEREAAHDPAARRAEWGQVDMLLYLNPAEFDEMLTSSIVFLDLYDTVVNNTVIECIVRNTPILCNRLPGLVELLGEDYPFFFRSLAEAADKAEDPALIRAAVAHLRDLPKDVFEGSHFLKSVVADPIYSEL